MSGPGVAVDAENFFASQRLSPDRQLVHTSDEIAHWLRALNRCAPVADVALTNLHGLIKSQRLAGNFTTVEIVTDLAGLAVGYGVFKAMDVEAANDKLTAQLGLTEKASARIGKVAGSLYSDAYYDPDTFDRLYDQSFARAVRKQTDPDGRLTDLYAKVVGRR